MSLPVSDRPDVGPTLLWLHGFTQTQHAAERFRSILAGSLTLVTPDLPGHGGAAHESASLGESGQQLADQFLTTPRFVGGYSFGGRTALHVALARPDHVERLVLLSTTLGIADGDERAQRRGRDEALAAHIRNIGTEAFLDEWLAQPLFGGLPRRDHHERSHDAEGLARSLELAGTGTQAYLGDAVATLTMPTLVLCGANDEKFVREGHALAERLPNATLHVVEGAGHALHMEQPDVVAGLVVDFLA